jgi:hypothetical protein
MPTSVPCTACGFQNTTTSLYCQDCGARLVAPPSFGGAAPAEAALPEPPKTKPRIISKHKTTPSGGLLPTMIRTLLLAAIAALIFVILQKPAGLPPSDDPLPEEVVKNVRLLPARSQQTGTPFEVPWSGEGLNAYLASKIKDVKPGGDFSLTLTDARISPSSDGFTLFTTHKIVRVPLHMKVTYRLVPRGNGIDLTRTGADLGRLPLPAWAAPLVDSVNSDLVHALAPDLQILRGAKVVRISPQKVSFNFGTPRP